MLRPLFLLIVGLFGAAGLASQTTAEVDHVTRKLEALEARVTRLEGFSFDEAKTSEISRRLETLKLSREDLDAVPLRDSGRTGVFLSGTNRDESLRWQASLYRETDQRGASAPRDDEA